jgi:hypothetical protein
MQQPIKEERKEKEEGRKKRERRRNSAGSRRRSPRRISLDLAGDPRFVFLFFFFQPWVSQPHLALAVPGFFLVLG